MIQGLPNHISIVFILTTLLTLYYLFRAYRSKNVIIGIVVWCIAQSVIGYSGFYQSYDSLPPRFLLLTGPALLTIILIFITKKGRNYMDMLDYKVVTNLHVVRIPVEIVLYWLFLQKQVPELMTFEGRNFDILAGITAPLVAYFGYNKVKIGNRGLIIWNVICLALLLNIVVNAVLSAPFPIQQFAFDQPNMAVFYFPYLLLPGCIVPVVMFSHLATLRQLIRKQ
jgi:hypothetical protein